MQNIKEIREVERWLKDTGMAESRLGLLSCANPKALDRIRNGTAMVSTLDSVLGYIRDHPNGED